MKAERDHRRCFVTPAAWRGATLTPAADELHHLVRVLRVPPGERVEVFDGAGRTGLAELAADGSALRLLQSAHHPRPAVELHLLQALPREQVMDTIIPKAVELGVTTISMAPAERSVVRLKADRLPGKLMRWRLLALNAARQCGAAWLPILAVYPTLADLFQTLTAGPARPDFWIVGSLAADAQPLRAALAAARAPARIGVLIGPEGDLTPAELAAAQAAGAVPVSFGPLTLRVDTAALFALSVLRGQYAP
ncbi:MAG: RsmE family RNA methyltransferase [Kiritimatiellaeota bacterium]|nr:RsmE family RNA methyltransferase [Kiritimatiellota bacterium]